MAGIRSTYDLVSARVVQAQYQTVDLTLQFHERLDRLELRPPPLPLSDLSE